MPMDMFEVADDIVIPGFSGAELRAEDFLLTLPEMLPRRPPSPNITVHQYTYGSQRNLRSSPLDIGRRVVDMATAASGWRTVAPPVFECMFTNNILSIHPPTLNAPTQWSSGMTVLLSTHLRPLLCCQKPRRSARRSGENRPRPMKYSLWQI